MKLSLNLATRTYVNRRALYMSYAAAGLLLVLWLGINLFSLRHDQTEISRLEGRLQQVRQQLGGLGSEDAPSFDSSDYRALIDDLAFADSVLERDAFRWTLLLGRLEQLLPDGVALRTLRPEHRERELSVTAVARGVEQMSDFLDRLMASEVLDDVYLLSQESHEVTDPSGVKRPAVRFDLRIKGAF